MYHPDGRVGVITHCWRRVTGMASAIGAMRETGEVLGEDRTTHRLLERVAAEPQCSRAVLQMDDDVAPCSIDRRNLGPRNAEIERAPESDPPRRQQQVSELIGSPASEPDGAYQVTDIVRGEWRRTSDDRKISMGEAVTQIECAERRADSAELLANVVLLKPKLSTQCKEPEKHLTYRLIASTVQCIPEAAQPP